MERPIFRFPKDTKDSAPKNIPPGDHSFQLNEMQLALKADDKKKFLDIMNRGIGDFQYSFMFTSLKYGLYIFDAEKCAKALLDGKAKSVTYYQAFCFDGFYELHNAARYQSLKVMMLLLKHDKNGSKANARCLARMGLCEGMLLPLHIAIAVPVNRPIFADWDDKNGVSDAFKLICRLCAPIMRHPLEIVRLLAQKTKGIEREAYIYAMEGKVVEFVILLMVASEKVLMTPLSLENKNDLGRTLTETVLSLISNVVASLVLLQQNVSSDDDTAIEIQKCMEKKAKLEQILVFIRIFETIGDRLCEYLQLEQTKPSFVEVTQHVGRIFEEGGIHSRPDVVEEDLMKKKYCWHGFIFPQRVWHRDFVRNVLMTRPSLLEHVYDLPDMKVLHRFDAMYEEWVHQHNSKIPSPSLSINLGDAYSLIWRYKGWEEKLSRLLEREHIAISPDWPPMLPLVPEVCYWVAPPGMLTANCDASLASRAIGVSFRAPRGELLGELIHQPFPDNVSTVEGGEVYAILKALEAGREILRGFDDKHKCNRGLLLLNDNLDMIKKLLSGESLKGNTPTDLLVNDLLQKARNAIADVERDNRLVIVLYVRRKSNQLADFVSTFDVSGLDQASLSFPDTNDFETGHTSTLLSKIWRKDANGELFFRNATLNQIRECCGGVAEPFTPKREKLLKGKR